MEEFTPLVELPALAHHLEVDRVWIKDEGKRLLGNFKSLGGLRAGYLALQQARPGAVLICASDGNHGLAVAAAARAAGAVAKIYLPRSIDSSRVDRIVGVGGSVVRVDGTYDAAVLLAEQASERGEGILIPDTSTDSRNSVVAEVLAGYRSISDELIVQLGSEWPTHIVVQAGVGGLAAAIAQGMLVKGGARMVIVEPSSAACVGRALQVGRPEQFEGDLATCADMLSCGLASASAIETLLQFDCVAITVEEPEMARAPALLVHYGGPRTTPSGAAGVAGLLAHAGHDQRLRLGLNLHSHVLLIITESSTS